ncbi:MAG: hypothetical protein NZ108_11200, partial [Bacteroidia bacterium]|nr:hypothetical protein [Bacteroidia bacterium]
PKKSYLADAMKNVRYLFVLSLLFLLACNRKLDLIEPKDYYPIIDGKYRIYAVKDSNYITTGAVSRFYYQKELTNGTELDLMNRTVSKLEIQRSDSLSNFQFFQVWTQYKNREAAERIEGNTKYVVLRFPVFRGKTWDGNQYNNFGVMNYQYLSIDTTVTVGGKTYSNCVWVLRRQSDPDSRQYNFLSYEIYAPGIGKIKQYDRYIEYIIREGRPPQIDSDKSFHHEEELLEHNY